ncbi:hypothetical protein [Streptomyces murinus]|uniref:hypothetical protein n=1 Tax=Streptomyces murinus TaxID=33900 RepID=UPI00380C308D
MQQGIADRLPAAAQLLPPVPPLPAWSGRRSDPPEAIRTWLVGAHRLSEQIRTEWSTQRVSMVPLGAGWGAVRIPGSIVHAAAGANDLQAVAEAVRAHLRGPVIYDRLRSGAAYWALIPYWQGTTWDNIAKTRLLGPGTYLGVPDVTVVEPPGTYWVTPPRYRHDLCRRQDVFDFVLRGTRRSREQGEPGSGQEAGSRR